MTAKLQGLAPIAMLLEGGYKPSAVASATEACLRVLLGQPAPELPHPARTASGNALRSIKQVIDAQVNLQLNQQSYDSEQTDIETLLLCATPSFSSHSTPMQHHLSPATAHQEWQQLACSAQHSSRQLQACNFGRCYSAA